MYAFVFKYKKEDLIVDKNDPILASSESQDRLTADFWGTVWVEPKTGFIIKTDDNWNCYKNEVDGSKKLFASGRTWQQEEETERVISNIQASKAMYQLYDMWIPTYLLLFALAFGIGALLKETSG
jgi:hypothetical protein